MNNSDDGNATCWTKVDLMLSTPVKGNVAQKNRSHDNGLTSFTLLTLFTNET